MAKRSVDNLIHAAGIFTDRGLVDELDFDAMHEEIEVNVIGPLRLTKGLLPNMKEGAKIAFISSAMGSIEENELGTSYGYRVSKASQNMIVKTLSNDLWSRMIAAVSIHPSYVKTEITGFSGHWEPADSARGIVARIDKLSMDTSGTFWHQNGRQFPW
jgi:NAD(P)-dependent dehydrogenase (short-subunit alcohol dehydrogenase family)